MSDIRFNGEKTQKTLIPCAWIAFAVFVTAYIGIELTRGSGRIASIWMANAVVLLALLETSPGRWAGWLLCGLIGNLAANLMAGDASLMAIVLALCNSLEIFLAGWLFHLWNSREKPDLTRLQSLFTFIGLAGVVAPAIAGATAALTLHMSQGLNFWSIFRTWSTADALGILIIVPLFAGTTLKEFTGMLRSPLRLEALAILLLVPVLSVTIVLGNHFPWIFLAGPLFLWAAFRFGFVGVASAIFLVTASGIGTLVFLAPHAEHLQDLRDEISFLQVFLFTNVLIFLPVANLIKSLRKNEGRYQSILETTEDGFWIVDLQGRLLQVNEVYCHMSGFSAQELLSMSISDLEAIESRSETAAHIQTIVTKGSDRFETRHRRKDGTIYEVEISAQCCPEIENAVITFARDITERKKAEGALRESEAQFRSFVENAPDGIFLTDRYRNYRLVNPVACHMTGYTAEEFALMNIRDLVPVEAVEETKAVHDRLAEDGRVSLETRLRRKDGSIFLVALDAVKIAEDHLLAFCKDISERKQAEEALHASNDKFTKLYDLSPDAIDLTHLETGVMVDCNQNFLKMFGYGREELIGRSTLPEDKGLWANAEDRLRFITGLKEHGEVFEFETPLRRKDGGIFTGLLSSSAVEIGGKLYSQCICRDISEQKRSEGVKLFLAQARWISEGEDFFKALAKFLAIHLGMDYVCIDRLAADTLSAKTLAIFFDGQFEDNVEYTLRDTPCGDVVGQNICCFPQGVRHRFPMDKVLQDMKAESYLGTTLWDSNRKPIGLIALIGRRPIQDSHFAESTLVLIAQRAERELEGTLQNERQRVLLAQFEQVQRMESLGTLVAGVAHNLNNVLAIAMGTASLREDLVTEPADREAYQSISKVCSRGREVVKSLIHFAQPAIVTQAPIELNSMILEVCALLESTTRNRVRIIETLTVEPLWISGSAGDINQILVNLGINSLDAMPNGGALTFRTGILEGDQVEVSVEDNGTGMTPEVLAHVLEPFYTTKEVGKGTGLGLSMTYGVVKAHGGSIDISSQPGQGTAVKLRFPRIPAPIRIEPGPVVPPSPAPASVKVFLVDDDEDVRFLMARMLKKAGVCQVKTFSGGEEVLWHLRSGESADLVILDQNMPGMNGVEVMARIREQYSEMPILISSGQPGIEAWADFKQPRIGVISKPFTMEEIQAKLAEISLKP